MFNFDIIKKAVCEAFKSIQSRPLMSMMSVGLIGVTMFLFSLILSCVNNADHLTNNIENQMRVSVFFKSDAEKANEYSIRDIIETDENVRSVTFVEKSDALEEMKGLFGKDNADVADGLNTIVNPLPDSLIVEVKDTTKMPETVEKISEFGDVEKVSYSKELVENVLSLITMTKAICFFFLAIIMFAMIAIMMNVARMAIHSRKTEIEVMKYLGAHDSLIIRPLFMEGMFLGAAGGIIAAFCFRIVYSVFITKALNVVPFLELIPIFPYITYQSFFIVFISAIIGGICTAMATRKYLYKE